MVDLMADMRRDDACPECGVAVLQWRTRAIAAEREVERLREELESVCDVGDRAAVMVAREALKRVGA
jgi:hypothetical protein